MQLLLKLLIKLGIAGKELIKITGTTLTSLPQMFMLMKMPT